MEEEETQKIVIVQSSSAKSVFHKNSTSQVSLGIRGMKFSYKMGEYLFLPW
jgi:hypothetical protein